MDDETIHVRHVRSLIGVSKFQADTAEANVLPTEFKLVGYNYDRNVAIILAVDYSVGSAGDAIRHADRWINRTGKVRPNTWRTTYPSSGPELGLTC